MALPAVSNALPTLSLNAVLKALEISLPSLLK